MTRSAGAADWRTANRANWDERVPIHVAGPFYDLPGFVAGRSTLHDFEVAEVGAVTGKKLLHLQCHIGLDTLSWARRGAVVTGLDFSAPAVAAAEDLAAQIGVTTARFVTADVYDAVQALDGRTFDIVYTGFGALCWLPDIDRWARTAADLVAPGASSTWPSTTRSPMFSPATAVPSRATTSSATRSSWTRRAPTRTLTRPSPQA
ncbi:class I SAM-dependent methyltransferase [Micromonospora sp. NPDC050495]|uniref:class I SAM-dependent methyltransferase n=1 Tax=Micromonospora sp. NPDC050495 TaxID=3154936 RepID=UPI0033D6677D